MNILITSSTTLEIKPLLDHLESVSEKKSFLEYRINGHSIYPLITGIGATRMAYAMAQFPKINTIQVAINGGICGSYDPMLDLGQVVEVVDDCFADLGAESNDGSMLDVYDLELSERDTFPFKDGKLVNDKRKYRTDITEVSGLTVNKALGTPLSIALMKEKYTAEVESMEGAGFFYACKMMDMACHQIRAVSNYVEPRNKDAWQLELAIERLNQSLVKFIHVLTMDRYT